MEGLNDMLRTAQMKGWIRGFNANMNDRRGLAISHLQYADDTLIFCDAREMPTKVFKNHLDIVRSHLRITHQLGESFIYPINKVPNINALANILGGRIGELPTVYLGMPLGDKRKSKGIWNNVLEKCEKKLVNWKSKYLSLGGRVTLINGVLDAMPTYMMSIFPMPANVIDRMDAIRNLKLQNRNLLMKWLWRFASQEQALWKGTIKARFGMENKWTTYMPTQPYGTGVWRSIRSQWIKFANNYKIKVGNGGKTLFWEDVWAGQVTLKNKYPDLFNLSLQKVSRIREMRDNQRMGSQLTRHHKDQSVRVVAGPEDDLESQGTLQGCMFHLANSQTGHTHPSRLHVSLCAPLNTGWNRDGNQSGHKERWKIVPAYIWWTIWMEKNQRCFENKSCSL
ncbi:hypothetical protein H5410_051346 [Solanum commersonii]|uniref:Uncharacterized protein n=1 Tax=Solanum commersonii TaxID=4109 RepID=A0A9J5WZA8_SOLCO|nr:hypothetical protein H5410_051346 [Solanum commersonii]